MEVSDSIGYTNAGRIRRLKTFIWHFGLGFGMPDHFVYWDFGCCFIGCRGFADVPVEYFNRVKISKNLSNIFISNTDRNNAKKEKYLP